MRHRWDKVFQGKRRWTADIQEEGKGQKKKCIYGTDWWMVRTIGGGVWRFLRQERIEGRVGDEARPLTSDYTKPSLLSLFYPSGHGDKRAAGWQCLPVCVYVVTCVCVCGCVCTCVCTLPVSAYCALKHKKMISGIFCWMNSMPLRLRQLVKDVQDEMVLGSPCSYSTWRKSRK